MLARARPRLLFARNFLANPRRVGSVIPSSPRLVKRLLGHTDWQKIRVAVEYGPGTGCVTRALLARLGPDARLFAFEINGQFVDYLRREITDPRLTVVAASAETVGAALAAAGIDHADIAVSSLPFSIMPVAVRQAIVHATADILAPGARLVGYQYSTTWLRELRHVFRHVTVQLEPRNWPPAFVFTARRD
ncbi:class I SAM-dependent methyltransferase [Polymorphobacter fuscus]|uniref:Methyltransferase domain-containing protein n=1 Tax=Sandarakinorhabdus fusca TaxID=1439888 RepID=A0A7C9KWI9_9SPHN|nr:methyltransferase domain-containing protein [Polymorphobacter fuscus]KAB7647730.1 methyltransferase domain-containing protein [Polymorphobacter fuscus]MQT17025.1 methyltransferase domain-containing protein [Polymorphobacter fuscus]